MISDNALISVIVPVYNVEKYLKKCLDSIINQTYKNLQIILVNDGSTDSSGLICDEYSKKDSRIVVIHKKNGGLSDARNVGLDNANGEYISFIDSDDYIEKNMILCLYQDCRDNQCQMANSNKILELENGKKFYTKEIIKTEIVNKELALKNLLLTDPSVANKLFSKKLFNKIRFIKGKLYEDILTTPIIIENCKKIFFDERYFYHYVQHDSSIVHNNFSKKKMDYMYNAKKLYNHIISNYSNLIEDAEAYYILVLSTIIVEAYSSRKEMLIEYNEVYSELKSFKSKYKKNKYISKIKKIMIFFCLIKQISFVKFIKKVKDELRYK